MTGWLGACLWRSVQKYEQLLYLVFNNRIPLAVFFNFVDFVVPVCCSFQRCYYALIMRDEVVHLVIVFCVEQAVAKSWWLQTLQFWLRRPYTWRVGHSGGCAENFLWSQCRREFPSACRGISQVLSSQEQNCDRGYLSSIKRQSCHSFT